MIQLPNGQQHGPLSRAEIESLIGCGAIPSPSLIREAQDTNWHRVSDLFSLPGTRQPSSAEQGSSGTSLDAGKTSDPSLASLFDHVNRNREQRSADRRSAEMEVRRLAKWIGGGVGVVLAGILGLLIVVDIANGNRHNFAAVAAVPIIAAATATAIATWVLPLFYSSLRKRN